MMFNTRGVRWNYEVKKLPPKPRMRKGSFLLGQALNFVKLLLVSDLFLQLSERLFWTSHIEGIESTFYDSKHLTISHPEWHWSFVKALVFAGGPYFFVNLQYVAVSIIAVGLSFSQVEASTLSTQWRGLMTEYESQQDWPPYFGDISEVTTVRHFWGTFWHQTLRRVRLLLTTRACETVEANVGFQELHKI